MIGRVLALLELYREQVVTFEQITPLGDLTIRWTGPEDADIVVTDEFDVEREVDRAENDDETSSETDTQTGTDAGAETATEPVQDEGMTADG